MTWYNPLSWFEKSNRQQTQRTREPGEIELICDNSYCEKPIKLEEDIALDIDRKRLYCDFDCAKDDGIREMLSNGKPKEGRIVYIKRTDALRLYYEGRLERSVKEYYLD